MIKPKKLEITKAAYHSILFSAIEVYPREVDGIVFSTPNGSPDSLVLTAQPILTSERLMSAVYNGNKAAVKRLEQAHLATTNGSGRRIAGGYHSHPAKDAKSHLSKTDKMYLTDLTTDKGMDFWVEVLVRIQRKTLLKDSDIGERIRKYDNSFMTFLRTAPRVAYHATFSAFLLEPENKVQKLELSLAEE